MEPIEKLLIESVEHLQKHNALNETILEAEAINLASYIYLRNDYRIDFELDFLSQDLLQDIPSDNYDISDKIFTIMRKRYSHLYSESAQSHGIKGYKMNIEMAPDYGGFLKNYFMKHHKIEESSEYLIFNSPRNCLWQNGIKKVDSPTHREIYYKFIDNTFEFMIPPFNPLVMGKIIDKTNSYIKCESGDGKRCFEFYYKGEISNENLETVNMHRIDKDDMVCYHKI